MLSAAASFLPLAPNHEHARSSAVATASAASARPLIPLGAYFGMPNGQAGGPSPLYPGFRAQWDGFVRIMGRAPTVYLWFNDQTVAPDSSFSWTQQGHYGAAVMRSDRRTAGIIPAIGVPFAFRTSRGLNSVFSEIALGLYDRQITGMLGNWRGGGYSVLYLRPAWEFNLPQFSPVDRQNLPSFLAAWRRFYAVVHDYAGANDMRIKVIWNPNVGQNQNDYSLTVAQQYPGDDYVDVIGMDTYGKPADGNANHYPDLVTSDPTYYLISSLLPMAKASGKSIAFCEMGGTDIVFAMKFIAVLRHSPVPIEFITMWDLDDAAGEESWSNPADHQTTLANLWAAALGADGTLRNP